MFRCTTVYVCLRFPNAPCGTLKSKKKTTFDRKNKNHTALLSGPPTDLMDDPFIPQRGRRAMQFVHSSGSRPKPLGSLVEQLARNARQQELLNGILHQHPRTLASNGYFMPVSHARADNAPADE